MDTYWPGFLYCLKYIGFGFVCVCVCRPIGVWHQSTIQMAPYASKTLKNGTYGHPNSGNLNDQYSVLGDLRKLDFHVWLCTMRVTGHFLLLVDSKKHTLMRPKSIFFFLPLKTKKYFLKVDMYSYKSNSDIHIRIPYNLQFKSLVFLKIFLVSYAHQGCIYLIKDIVKTVILWNITF